MSILPDPHELDVHKIPRKPPLILVRFGDPANPAIHPSVPYSSDKWPSELSDEEIAGYWEKLVAAHPEFAPPSSPELPPGL